MKIRRLIISLLLGVVSFSSLCSCNYLNYNQDNYETNQLETKIVENGINIKSVVDVSSNAKYGAKQFNYEVYPSNYAGSINYSLKYPSGSTPAESVLKVTHDENNHSFIIECGNVFSNQATLRIYSDKNTSVYATVTIDFVEKITVDSTMVCNEGSIINFNSNVSGTGGTILANKTA